MTLLGFIYQLDMHPLHLKYTLSPLLLATKLKQVDNTDLKNNANTDTNYLVISAMSCAQVELKFLSSGWGGHGFIR